jgi:hypothetical protein
MSLLPYSQRRGLMITPLGCELVDERRERRSGDRAV